jgi:hypothetical protein
MKVTVFKLNKNMVGLRAPHDLKVYEIIVLWLTTYSSWIEPSQTSVNPH